MSDNIQVVVRCRGRNTQEVAAKSPIIVELPNDEYSCDEPYVTIASSRLSALSGVSKGLPASGKSFKVDQVYGPNADQALLFENVALPLFHDFVAGLNVTILAYGQTGSGKTYSMFGDVDGDDSGIIPRVLSRLFTSKTKDCLVKVSCTELYNEELLDLNHDETVATSTKTRPWLSAGKNSQPAQIMNINESEITTSKSGFDMLKRCLDKRKTSATKLNDQSSRSHTIVSISLWKESETSGKGDQFCFSKMNLVDLAGSEDVGKSGAVKDRAREAGCINQSLLALGKVISFLSEGKTAHIPYRESKLTRILEESLGGRTKTAFIATVSPAEVNAKETVSTLAYASKAKNIKNLPQSLGGNFVPKNVLVFDLAGKLERERKDRLDAAEKDGGVKVSKERLEQVFKAEQEHGTVVKEMEAKNAKLLGKLEAKTAELEALQHTLARNIVEHQKRQQESLEHSESLEKKSSEDQNKIISLTAELAEARRDAGSKSLRISELEGQICESEKAHSLKEQAFSKNVSMVRAKTDEVLSELVSHISAGSVALTSEIDAQKEKVAGVLHEYQQELSNALGALQQAFGSEWKTQLEAQIENNLDVSNHLKKLSGLDVSGELSGLARLDKSAYDGIKEFLEVSAHPGLLESAASKSADNAEKLVSSLVPELMKVIRASIGGYQKANTSVIEETVTAAFSRVSQNSEKLFECSARDRKQLTDSISLKTAKHVQDVGLFGTTLEEKKTATAARIYDQTRAHADRTAKTLSASNLQKGSRAGEMVSTCLDETRRSTQASYEEIETRLNKARGEYLPPLTELKDTNTVKGSPRGKTLRSPVQMSMRAPVRSLQLSQNLSPTRPNLQNGPKNGIQSFSQNLSKTHSRSPVRFPDPSAKRQKTSPGRSQIPLLAPHSVFWAAHDHA